MNDSKEKYIPNCDRHNFPYEWTLKDAIFKKDKGTVFSCFAGGGGSTMGYKLAGFDVIGCNEIDKRMMNLYIENHNPKYAFTEPIQDLKNRDDLPEELYNLDILDGSPPCSSFSISGKRDKYWGQEKKFREGQMKQVLDTLFFDFIDLANKLQPKIVIAENVKGILYGKAKVYVKRIYEEFDKAGYVLDHYVFDSSKMGIPQKRERVFFIAVRKDLYPLAKDKYSMGVFDINTCFTQPVIPYSEIEDITDTSEVAVGKLSDYWYKVDIGENFSKKHPKGSYFSHKKLFPDVPVPTILASHGQGMWNYRTKRVLNIEELIKASSFPSDYNFCHELTKAREQNNVKYVVGMSVPPVMVAEVATRIHTYLLSKINNA